MCARDAGMGLAEQSLLSMPQRQQRCNQTRSRSTRHCLSQATQSQQRQHTPSFQYLNSSSARRLSRAFALPSVAGPAHPGTTHARPGL